MSWLLEDNSIIGSIEDIPEGAIGFAYRIINRTKDKAYIGRKSLYSVRKKKFSKKRLSEISDKRIKTYEYITKESDWLKYQGSNKELIEDIKSGDVIDKIILEFAYSKQHLTYLELKYQFKFEVLESDRWYNDNLLGKFYRKLFDFESDTK